MSIFVYAENTNGKYKKAALEAVSYAKAIADKMGDTVTAITINPTDTLGTFIGNNKIDIIAHGFLWSICIYRQSRFQGNHSF
jgi:electron transfer flavoprotein alpha subunit